MNDDKPKIKFSLKNNKILQGEFYEEKNERIELHNAFFSDCPSFIFNISIRIDDIIIIVEDKDVCCTNTNTGKFVTDSEYTKGEGSKKDDKQYVPKTIIKDGKVIVDEKDIGLIEDINIDQQDTKYINGHKQLYNQIQENEKRFGVKIDFDESLYTSELDKDSNFYKNNIERAKKIERQILSDRKRFEYEDDEGYSTVKSKDSESKKILSKPEPREKEKEKESKKIVKQNKQIENTLQNKEPTNVDNLNNKKDNGEVSKMLYNDKKQTYNGRKEQYKKANIKTEKVGGAISAQKIRPIEEAGIEPSKIIVTKPYKEKTPMEAWSTFETESIKITSEEKKPLKNERNKTVNTKRVSFGKPTESKYKNFDELYNAIVSNFKDSKETKKWSHVDDQKSFRSHSNDYYTNKYTK